MNQIVELHIDELVLHGFSAHDRYQISAVVEAELTRLFTERGIPATLSTGKGIPSLNAGAFQIAIDAKSYTVGNTIANSVYKTLRNG